jgi:hypothetical protein
MYSCGVPLTSDSTVAIGAAVPSREPERAMFVASDRFLPLEYLGIPHRIAGATVGLPVPAERRGLQGFAFLTVDGSDDAPRLYWPRADDERLEGARPARHDLNGIPLYARVIDGKTLAACLPRGWHAESSAPGAGVPVWRHDDGSILLPFDPAEAMELLWSERYLAETAGRGLTSAAHFIYYRLRPALPRRLQIALRRSYARIQARREFPRWPVEPALHDVVRLLYGLLTEVAGTPVPWIGPWPRGYRWAVVLTHDVDTAVGQAQIGALRDVERELGYRSSWNFPALRYPVDEPMVAALRDEGCEVGVHGANHDGRDLESLRMIDERLPAMRDAAERWGAEGFRAPATQRRWQWMPRLGFDYDTSFPDSDPYEPQPGGCCTWWPYFNEAMVELPITMPQDHTLFTILQQDDETIWLDKARTLRQRSGMALFLTHPDYLGTTDAIAPYRRTLLALADDASAWRALPREVAGWWRRRAASTIAWDGTAWRVTGPASDEAAVCLDPP